MLFGSSGFRPNREGEALSRRAKRYVSWNPGQRGWFKRKFWKKARQVAKQMLRNASKID